MASTLIQRICAPDYTLEVPQEKLAILTLCAVAQEVLLGRVPTQMLGGWLTPEEIVDAQKILGAIQQGAYSLDNVERVLLLGEEGIYSVTVVQQILGLIPPPA